MQIGVKSLGYIALISTLLIVGAVPLAYKIGSAVTTIEFSFLVFLIATLMSFFVMLARRTHVNIKTYASKKEHLWVFAAIGIFFLAQTVMLSYGTHYISASLTSVLYRSWPLMLILLSPFLLKERVTKWDFSAVVIGFAGMSATLLSGTAISLPLAVFPYVGIVLLAALVDAFQSGFQKRFQYELSSATFLENFIGLSIIAPFAIFTGVLNIPLDVSILVPALLIGILQNVMLSYLFPLAFRIVKTSIASVTLMLPPFVTMIFSFLLLGEQIQISYLVIALSVFLGLAVQRFAPRKTTYISKTRISNLSVYDLSAAFANTKSKLVYEQLKGEGRVLGFYKNIVSAAESERYAKIIDSANVVNGCLILTNKSNKNEIMPDELALVKEIMGHNESDFVVLGVGKPKAVEDTLVDIHRRMLE